MSPEVNKPIQAVAVMQPGTKLVEDTIGHDKGVAEQSSAMKMGASAIWHSASTGGIIEGLGWTQPRRTQVAKTCTRSDGVSKTTFECNDKDFSLGTDVLFELTIDKTHVVQRESEQPQIRRQVLGDWPLTFCCTLSSSRYWQRRVLYQQLLRLPTLMIDSLIF